MRTTEGCVDQVYSEHSFIFVFFNEIFVFAGEIWQ